MLTKMMKVMILFSVLFLALGLVMTFLLSFFSFYRYPQLFPSGFTFEYWENILINNPSFFEMIVNTMIIGILTGVLSTFFGFMTGYGLVKMRLHTKNKFIIIYSLPLLMPVSALIMGIHMVLLKIGVVQSLLGVILAHSLLAVPYAINIGISYISGISPEMVNIARTLGGRKKDIFLMLIVPLLKPGMKFSFALGFLISVSDYLATLLIGGGGILTLSVVYYPYLNRGDYGHASVLSIVFVTLNIMLFIWLQKRRKTNLKIGGYLHE